MNIKYLLAITTLFAATAFGQAMLIERPIYHQFNNQKEPFVISNVLFGTLANGNAAITKNSKGHAFFYERHSMFNKEMGIFIASGIDCKAGSTYVVAIGPIDGMTAVKKEEAISIKNKHPESTPTYRKICESVDLPMGKW